MFSKHRITHIIFAFLSLVMSALIWHQFNNGLSLLEWSDLVLMASMTILVMALFLLSSFLFSARESYIIFLAFLSGFLIILGFSWQYWLAVLIAFLFFFYARQWMVLSIKSHIKASFYPLVLYGSPAILTALSVLFAFASYFYPLNLNTFQLGEKWIGYVTPFTEYVLESRMPSYQKGMTLDEFLVSSLTASITSTAGDKGIDLGSMGAGSELFEKEIQKEAIKQRKDLSERFGVELTGNENIQQLLLIVANSYLNRYLVSYKELVPWVVAISVFLAIKSLGLIINRFAVLLAWILSKALISAKIIQVKIITAEKEYLSI